MSPVSAAPASLSVSIVLYHSPVDVLGNTLDSLCRAVRFAQSSGQLGEVSVEVLDNSSNEVFSNSAHNLVSQFARGQGYTVNYVKQDGNQGFGVAHNKAIQVLTSDLHLILNPDVVLQENALSVGLAALANDETIALLSPRVTNGAGAQEFLCKRYPSVLALLLRGFAPGFVQRPFARRLERYEMRDVCTLNTQVDVELASGCFMLVRSADLLSVRGFDPNYFLYFEDFDLSLRLASRGRLVFEPAMQIVHHGGYAASKGFRHIKYFLRSATRFFHENGWRWI
jgi:GT2 family glycosyltransferase